VHPEKVTQPKFFPERKNMNTLAKLYKQSLSLFNSEPASEVTESFLLELVSAFAVEPFPVATVDLIKKSSIKESHKVFWHVLKDYGLSVEFISRDLDSYAFVILKALPLQAAPFVGTRVIERLSGELNWELAA
jgi:hypothetical protein